jgi:hypothetical protein
MAFRHGAGGPSEWGNYRDAGVAAITYGAVHKIDLTRYSRGEAEQFWREAGLAPAQKYSLRQFVFKMQKGDIIYAKEGPLIVGRGTIVGDYRFSPHTGLAWPHQRAVNWQQDFNPVAIQIGGVQQYAIRPLTRYDIKRLSRKSDDVQEKANTEDALEGGLLKKEILFRIRNRGLIEQKKVASDYCCEVCGFNFERWYGADGHKFIVAHHIEPLGHRKRNTRTRLEDIALVCANCHAMVHRRNPPIPIKRLRRQTAVQRLIKLIAE